MRSLPFGYGINELTGSTHLPNDKTVIASASPPPHSPLHYVFIGQQWTDNDE